MPMYWNELTCKKCGETVKAKKDGLTMFELAPFVVDHLIECYDFFEITHKIVDKGEKVK